MYVLDGYNSAFANCKNGNGRGKGVGIFYRNDSNIEICEEDLYQFVKYKNANCTIFCVYLSKGCDFNQVVQSLKHYDFNERNQNTLYVLEKKPSAIEINHHYVYYSDHDGILVSLKEDLL